MPSSFFTKTGTSALVMTGVLLVGAVLRAGQLPVLATGTPAPAQDATLFETRIRPLLAANCFACHGESAMAGLRVDSRAGLLRGGETGPAIVPGDPDKSALLKAVQHADGFPRMPRGRATPRDSGRHRETHRSPAWRLEGAIRRSGSGR